MKSLLEDRVIGDVYQFIVEVYGNVVSKKAEGFTWRAKRTQGGGCLYDYTSHGLDLVNYLIGSPKEVKATVFRTINSKELEDAVSSTLIYDHGLTGQLSVNWCDPSYRKMFNQITLWGTKGKIIADRQECKIYLQEAHENSGLTAGWNILYTTELTKPVDFYIRGEEYSYQLDYFIDCIEQKRTDNISSFAYALQTDIVIDLLSKDAKREKV